MTAGFSDRAGQPESGDGASRRGPTGGRSDRVDPRFELVEEVPAYRGVRYAMHLVREKLPNGKIAERDVVRHPGASVVIPILDDGRVLLVEQHRTALGENLIEIPAGVLEGDEDPSLAAARELEEETGYRARKIERLLDFHPSAGFCDEIMHIFVATGLEPTQQNLDADEFITVHVRTFEEVRQLVRDGELTDGKTIAAFLYLLAFRADLFDRGLGRDGSTSK